MNNKLILKLTKNVENFIENEKHYGDHHSYIACNVKMHGNKHYISEADIIPICKELKLSKPKQEYINNLFNDEKINDIFYCWLEQEARYLQDDFFEKCCISSSEYWDNEIKNTQRGKNCSYPAINDIKELDKKIHELTKWKNKDIKEGQYIDILKHCNGLSGFFGRSSGWYAILEVNRLENMIDEIENADNWEDKIYFYNQLKDLYNACQWALKTITVMHKGMDLKNEIEYRIEDALQETAFIEDASAITYAIS